MEYLEAIRILHPDTTREALEKIRYHAGFRSIEAEIKAINEACLLACEAMEKVMKDANNGNTPESDGRD